MGARRYCLVTLLLLLVPAQAWAHLHKAAVYGAPSWSQGSSLGGVQLSGELVVHKLPAESNVMHPLVGVFVDLGANWGEHGDGERTQAAVMVGGRVTWGRGWVEPFVHIAGARVRTQDSAPNDFDTAWGFDIGAGLSFRLSRAEKVYLRAQYDRTYMGGSDRITDKYKRFSVGIELRIHRAPKCP
jgi:Outer membrane protein beta-barrel domain